jgi:hypothetical protein
MNPNPRNARRMLVVFLLFQAAAIVYTLLYYATRIRVTTTYLNLITGAIAAMVSVGIAGFLLWQDRGEKS